MICVCRFSSNNLTKKNCTLNTILIDLALANIRVNADSVIVRFIASKITIATHWFSVSASPSASMITDDIHTPSTLYGGIRLDGAYGKRNALTETNELNLDLDL